MSLAVTFSCIYINCLVECVFNVMILVNVKILRIVLILVSLLCLLSSFISAWVLLSIDGSTDANHYISLSHTDPTVRFSTNLYTLSWFEFFCYLFFSGKSLAVPKQKKSRLVICHLFTVISSFFPKAISLNLLSFIGNNIETLLLIYTFHPQA